MAAVTTKSFEIDLTDTDGKSTTLTVANAKNDIDADALEGVSEKFVDVGYTIVRGRYVTKTVDDYIVL